MEEIWSNPSSIRNLACKQVLFWGLTHKREPVDRTRSCFAEPRLHLLEHKSMNLPSFLREVIVNLFFLVCLYLCYFAGDGA